MTPPRRAWFPQRAGPIHAGDPASPSRPSSSSVFSDADNDALTVTAASSNNAIATATVAADQSTLTVAGVAEGTATITVTAQDSDGNRVSDAFAVSVAETPAEVDHGEPTPVGNLRCLAETERVAFLWDVPEWPGGELNSYDFELTLPNGREEGGRLHHSITLVHRPDSYQSGQETRFSITANYETPDGSAVSSAEATLTCTVGE